MTDPKETIDAMISIVDKNGKYIYVNQRTAELHNLSMNEMIGKSIFELYEKQTASSYMNHIFKPILADGREIDTIGSVVIGGKNHHFEYHCSPILDEQGELFGILNIANDYSEKQTRMKHALIEQKINFIRSLSGGLEQTLKEIFSQLCRLDYIDYGGIYILNEENQSLDLVCHYNFSLDFMKKFKSYNRLDKDTRQFKTVSKGIPQYQHFMNLPQDVKAAYEQLGVQSIALIPLIYDDQINGCIAIGSQMKECISEPEKIFIESIAWRLSGIIALYNMQVKLSRTNEELNQTIIDLKEKQSMLIHKSKMESMGELAAGMAHEINQPLLVISMSMENIMQKVTAGQKNLSRPYLQKKFDAILHNINRIQQISDNMRIFAQDQSSILFEKVDISEVIEKSLSMLRVQYRSEGIKLVTGMIDEKLYVIGNLIKLEQVIVNLLSNSRFAVNEKEKRAGSSSYQKEIKLEVTHPENVVIIEVWDNGIGMPQENIEKAFIPFFTTKMEGKDTGLGLSIVYGIVKEMDGDIKIDSRINEFTQIQIILPSV